MGAEEISEAEIEALYQRMKAEAEQGGYRLNPKAEFTRRLIKGLLMNKGRYGYISCPCRLSTGRRADDLDIICPCDYRDPDLSQYGACYCGLYVSEDIYKGVKKLGPVPERRPPKTDADGGAVVEMTTANQAGAGFSLKYPVWRCKVCGYLCARDEPPGVCPVCKASRDRFERFV